MGLVIWKGGEHWGGGVPNTAILFKTNWQIPKDRVKNRRNTDWPHLWSVTFTSSFIHLACLVTSTTYVPEINLMNSLNFKEHSSFKKQNPRLNNYEVKTAFLAVFQENKISGKIFSSSNFRNYFLVISGRFRPSEKVGGRGHRSSRPWGKGGGQSQNFFFGPSGLSLLYK